MLKKHIGFSLLTVLLLVSSSDAGKIITDANISDIVVTPNQQFGFGGWNFDNVDVRIVNTDDFSGSVGTFYENNGTYTPMGVDKSFESDIISREDNVTVMGHLHGKDWPVGEPAGIKIINDDLNVQHGKPVNCIMTSSYQEFAKDDNTTSGYLDGNPNPVLCSSPFQTHKRYKINLLPETVDGVAYGEYGKSVDLVFNLDPDDNSTEIRRYQVLQKVNNYTNVRLDGYKIEVRDENGSKNPALTLSLGEGEGDEGADIWAIDDRANYSHGLWGPYEENKGVVRFDNGFFDYKRAYFPVELSDNNHTISYFGDMNGGIDNEDGGNYQEIFGNWLPSIWEPTGIFFDEDHDPATDNVLQAFFGIAPEKTELTWWKSSVVYDPSTPATKPVYTWVKATEQDMNDWSGEWYNEGPIEDVLNLGLNYIINVGSNAAIGKTFILRLTPHIAPAEEQVPPVYVCGEDQHYKQGTLHCIDNTMPVITPPYLPDYDGLIQGTMDADPEANPTDFNLSLPVCGDDSLPTVQGTSADCL